MMTIEVGQLLIDREVRDNPTWSDFSSPLAIVTGKGVRNDGVPYWTLVYVVNMNESTVNGGTYNVTYDMLMENYDILPRYSGGV